MSTAHDLITSILETFATHEADERLTHAVEALRDLITDQKAMQQSLEVQLVLALLQVDSLNEQVKTLRDELRLTQARHYVSLQRSIEIPRDPFA